jgi:hypothetical protein
MRRRILEKGTPKKQVSRDTGISRQMINTPNAVNARMLILREYMGEVATKSNILGSPHNPKFLWVDDAKIVGDRITEVRPVPGNFFAQKTERRISELGACCVGVARR